MASPFKKVVTNIFHSNISFMIVNNSAPGMPKILTNIMVKKFNPMWKLNRLPIKFINSNIPAPINEFKNNLATNLSGKINILHNTKIMQSPDRYVNILITSIFQISPRPFCTYYETKTENMILHC